MAILPVLDTAIVGFRLVASSFGGDLRSPYYNTDMKAGGNCEADWYTSERAR
jgi:hypothetical protein